MTAGRQEGQGRAGAQLVPWALMAAGAAARRPAFPRVLTSLGSSSGTAQLASDPTHPSRASMPSFLSGPYNARPGGLALQGQASGLQERALLCLHALNTCSRDTSQALAGPGGVPGPVESTFRLCQALQV